MPNKKAKERNHDKRKKRQDIKVWKREQKRKKKEKRDGSNEKQYIRMA